MKKWFLVLFSVFVLSLLVLTPLTAFAEDRPEYEYTVSYFPSDIVEFDEHYILENLNLSRPLTVRGDTYNPNQRVVFDYSEFGTLVIGEENPDYSDPNEDEYLLRYTDITVTDLPIVFYSFSSTLRGGGDDYIYNGTLVVPETSVPETTSAPSAYGSSVSDGVTSGISYVGLVLSSIINSPVFIFVGLAVGCYLVTLSISKVKDLIKGY